MIIIRTLADNNEMRKGFAALAAKNIIGRRVLEQIARQACAVVHAASHALGYPIYDLTSIIYRLGIHHCIDAVERRKQEYIDKVFYWSEHFAEYSREWADFLNK